MQLTGRGQSKQMRMEHSWTCENRKDCSFIAFNNNKKNSGWEKKVYFIIVFDSLFSVFLYMSITVYSFDKLLFENEVFCVWICCSSYRKVWSRPTIFHCLPLQHEKHRHVFVIGRLFWKMMPQLLKKQEVNNAEQETDCHWEQNNQ